MSEPSKHDTRAASINHSPDEITESEVMDDPVLRKLRLQVQLMALRKARLLGQISSSAGSDSGNTNTNSATVVASNGIVVGAVQSAEIDPSSEQTFSKREIDQAADKSPERKYGLESLSSSNPHERCRGSSSGSAGPLSFERSEDEYDISALEQVEATKPALGAAASVEVSFPPPPSTPPPSTLTEPNLSQTERRKIELQLRRARIQQDREQQAKNQNGAAIMSQMEADRLLAIEAEANWEAEDLAYERHLAEAFLVLPSEEEEKNRAKKEGNKDGDKDKDKDKGKGKDKDKDKDKEDKDKGAPARPLKPEAADPIREERERSEKERSEKERSENELLEQERGSREEKQNQSWFVKTMKRFMGFINDEGYYFLPNSVIERQITDESKFTVSKAMIFDSGAFDKAGLFHFAGNPVTVRYQKIRHGDKEGYIILCASRVLVQELDEKRREATPFNIAAAQWMADYQLRVKKASGSESPLRVLPRVMITLGDGSKSINIEAVAYEVFSSVSPDAVSKISPSLDTWMARHSNLF